MQETPPELGYVWSNVRVAEQVTINVLTWGALAILAGVLAGLGIVAQLLTHYIVVPTHILIAIAFIGIGIALTLGVSFGVFYLYLRKHPELALGLAFGYFAVAAAIAIHKNMAQQEAQQATANKTQREQAK